MFELKGIWFSIKHIESIEFNDSALVIDIYLRSKNYYLNFNNRDEFEKAKKDLSYNFGVGG